MALSESGKLIYQTDPMLYKYDVVAGAINIYRTALLNRNASGDVLLGTDAASQTFAGVAYEELLQAAGASAGDNQIQVIGAKTGKVVKLQLTSVTKANIGLDVYVNGDDIVALVGDTTNDVRVGTIVDIAETNFCYVILN